MNPETDMRLMVAEVTESDFDRRQGQRYYKIEDEHGRYTWVCSSSMSEAMRRAERVFGLPPEEKEVVACPLAVADLEIEINVAETVVIGQPVTRVPGTGMYSTVRRRQPYDPTGYATRNATHSIETVNLVYMPGKRATREEMVDALDTYLKLVLR